MLLHNRVGQILWDAGHNISVRDYVRFSFQKFHVCKYESDCKRTSAVYFHP